VVGLRFKMRISPERPASFQSRILVLEPSSLSSSYLLFTERVLFLFPFVGSGGDGEISSGLFDLGWKYQSRRGWRVRATGRQPAGALCSCDSFDRVDGCMVESLGGRCLFVV